MGFKIKLTNMIKVAIFASYLILTYFLLYLYGYYLDAVGLDVMVCPLVHHLLILVVGLSPVVIENINIR